jgi:ubiquinone/menaquinone biosynthesis C-methylase UbiE
MLMALRKQTKTKTVDYGDRKIRTEVLVRQRREMWTPEQIASFTKHFRLRRGMKLLDAGCGYGYSLRTFGPSCMPGAKLVGIDVEMQLLRTARQLFRDAQLEAVSTFINGNVYDLPFHKNTFDITIAQVVLCHLADPEKALDELVRVTKRNGCIAVFDNAVAGGGYGGWTNVYRPSLKRKVFDYEMNLRSIRGKKKMGKGDFNVGCYLPIWMERRGLKYVNARCNERVVWVAPPYRSPAQKTTIRNMKERIKNGKFDPKSAEFQEEIAQLRAGGVAERTIPNIIRAARRQDADYRRAVKDNTIAYAMAVGGFWCVWGFKP